MNKSIQEAYIRAIDERIIEAGKVMDLDDLTEEESENAEVYDTVYEARFHCGVCIVNTVMETIWSSVDEYLDYLEGLVRAHEAIAAKSHAFMKDVFTSIPTDKQEALLHILADLNTEPEPLADPRKQTVVD